MRDRVIQSLDEAALKAEVAEAAERFRRDYFPEMQAGAQRVEPYVRQVYERCTGLAVGLDHQPQRLPPQGR
jgi:hypothetical protein